MSKVPRKHKERDVALSIAAPYWSTLPVRTLATTLRPVLFVGCVFPIPFYFEFRAGDQGCVISKDDGQLGLYE